MRAASLVADRRFGIGCDQLLIIRPSDKADIFMQILNNDGSTAGACGNGTRCVADYVMRGQGVDRLNIETDSGILSAYRSQIGDADLIAVNMGVARLEWHQVPLGGEQDTLHVDLGADAPALAVCHSMGNPHAVMFVEDVAVIDLEDIGPKLEHADIFPDRANISIVQKLDDAKFRMRVWERSVGITLACGSGACAVGVAAHRRGLAGRSSEIVMDGGSVFIEWRDDGTKEGEVIMTGPVAYVGHGVLDASVAALFGDHHAKA
jgi:diaminopimelate epimerase